MKYTHYVINIKNTSCYKLDDEDWPDFNEMAIPRVGEYIWTSLKIYVRVDAIFHSVKDWNGNKTHVIDIHVI